MSDFLVDTNVLLRWAHSHDPDYLLARSAVETLSARGDVLYVTPQNLIEFWNVSTRPVARNGFGLDPGRAHQAVLLIEIAFQHATDTPDIFPEWLHLVTQYGVSGVQVHDARLAAVMRVHGLTHVLTFNTADFTRYAGLTPVHPSTLAAPTPGSPS